MTVCGECGFDASDWRPHDVAQVFDALEFWWQHATAGLDDDDLDRRPAAGVPSTAEHGQRMFSLSPELTSVHDMTHGFMDISRGLVAMGLGTPAAKGTVVQINTSDGGVPKLPVASDRVSVDRRGLAGDRQFDEKHHGRPFQAVCLWSTEVIAELAGLGHPIAAGCAGENMTLTGVDWSTLRPGTALRIGSAHIELSYPAVPCKKQTRWFTDGDFKRIAHERNPQWVRWYGWVREPGEVATGDTVTVSPTPA